MDQRSGIVSVWGTQTTDLLILGIELRHRMPGRAIQGLRQVFKFFGGQRIFGNTVKKVTNLLAETTCT